MADSNDVRVGEDVVVGARALLVDIEEWLIVVQMKKANYFSFLTVGGTMEGCRQNVVGLFREDRPYSRC